MNNEPVAWIDPKELDMDVSTSVTKTKQFDGDIPLYTHPVKEKKCVVKDCENHKNEGGFTGDLCNPCYQFIANGEGVYSQAYRNVHPVKELTDEEIQELALCDEFWISEDCTIFDWHKFARAILRKAQENG